MVGDRLNSNDNYLGSFIVFVGTKGLYVWDKLRT